MKKHDQDQYSLFVESSIEDQLAAEGITYTELPKSEKSIFIKCKQ